MLQQLRELDPGDRRYITIRLTEAGMATFKEIESSMSLYFEQIFNSIPDDKKEQVLDSLQVLLKAIAESDCCCS